MKKQLRLIWALVALTTVAMAGVTVEIDGFEVFKENDFNFATRIKDETVPTWEWAQNWKDARKSPMQQAQARLLPLLSLSNKTNGMNSKIGKSLRVFITPSAYSPIDCPP